ncbi:MAG: DUF3592 domain-containing protein [Chitinophagaceae bacterium]
MWYTLTLIVGLVLLAISLFLLRESLAFLRSSERAIGTVIELKSISDSDGTTYKPVFRFKTNLGEEIVYTHHSSSNPPGWDIGDKATFAYDAGNPSVARLMTYFGTFNWTVILMSIAMPMIVIGGGYHLSQYVLK